MKVECCPRELIPNLHSYGANFSNYQCFIRDIRGFLAFFPVCAFLWLFKQFHVSMLNTLLPDAGVPRVTQILWIEMPCGSLLLYCA